MTSIGRAASPRRRFALILVLVLVLALALAAVGCGSETAGPSDAGAAGTTQPDRTVPRSTTENAPPTTRAVTTTSTSKRPLAEEMADRIEDASDVPICVEVPPSTPVEIPEGFFAPRTVQPGAQMAGASTLGAGDFTTVVGDDDLTVIQVPQDRSDLVTLIGDLDRTTGAFERRIALGRCRVASAETDGTHLWLLIAPQEGGVDKTYLVEVALATGATTWKARLGSLAWWQPDGDVVRVGVGGAHIGHSYPEGPPPPFGVETIEVGTGAVVASVDIQPMFPRALASDDGLWIRSQAYETSDRLASDDPFREIDLATGTKTRSFAPEPGQIPVIQDGAMWTLVPGGVERRPLDTTVPQVISVETGSDLAAELYVGPSGAWVVSVPVPDQLTVIISRIDTTTGVLQGSFSYTTYATTMDRSGAVGPVRPYLRVDAHGARAEALAAPYDGGGEPPARGWYEIVVP